MENAVNNNEVTEQDTCDILLEKINRESFVRNRELIKAGIISEDQTETIELFDEDEHYWAEN